MVVNKSYSVKFFFNIFELSIHSEDRENGEYKHFIDIYILGLRCIDVCYRTGNNNIYVGNIVKNNFFRTLWYTVILEKLTDWWYYITFKLLKLDIGFPLKTFWEHNHFDMFNYPNKIVIKEGELYEKSITYSCNHKCYKTKILIDGDELNREFITHYNIDKESLKQSLFPSK